MTESRPVVIIGAGHNGLVCAAYLARAGHTVQVLEARQDIGGAASTRDLGDGFRVSGVAHIPNALSARVCRDLDLTAAGLEAGSPVDTIALDRDGQHLTLGRDLAAGDGLSAADVRSYQSFKQEYRAYARALEPM